MAAWCRCAELVVGVIHCSIHVASNIIFSKIKLEKKTYLSRGVETQTRGSLSLMLVLGVVTY